MPLTAWRLTGVRTHDRLAALLRRHGYWVTVYGRDIRTLDIVGDASPWPLLGGFATAMVRLQEVPWTALAPRFRQRLPITALAR